MSDHIHMLVTILLRVVVVIGSYRGAEKPHVLRAIIIVKTINIFYNNIS